MKIIIRLIRRIFGILNLSEQINENNKMLREINWAQIFNSTINNSVWLNDKSFSPGQFSIGYPMFYVLYRILDEVKPTKILEFGLGQSTKLFHQYVRYHKTADLITLEHDSEWMAFYMTNKALPENAVIKTVKNVTINYRNHKTLSIGDLNEIVGDKIFDLILVDAPFGSVRYSRSQVLSLIPTNINQNHFIIIMDDYNRQGEKDTCNLLENSLTMNNINYIKGIYSGVKEFAIYCSTDLRFLATL